MKKKVKSTYEEFAEDKEQRALLEKEYKELLFSELLIEAMEHGKPTQTRKNRVN